MKVDGLIICCWVVWALAVGSILMLSGCTTDTIRITEYSAESPVFTAATVGGCAIDVDETVVPGDLSVSYQGEKYIVEYKANGQ